MAQKPSIPKGTRDFGPIEAARRDYIFNTLSDAFRLFGYRRIETPALENLSTLTGKYGEEGDKLLFKILNSGDFRKGVSASDFEEMSAASLAAKFCEKGLRYDLTVPLARFAVQHRAELNLPFKRFQIQPVWRADRPQKGRYREFYQCDADAIGSNSLNCEIELLMLVDYAFCKLGVRTLLKLNNRKVLAGIAEVVGMADNLIGMTVAIDKIDKIGYDAVCDELRAKGISDDGLSLLRPILHPEGSTEERLAMLKNMLKDSEIGMIGIEELTTVAKGFESVREWTEFEIDPSLARGLDYYTGSIMEVKALDASIGSICGGGRYDNLTGVFGMPGLTGVGISFGADRIYDVMSQLNLFPEKLGGASKVMFVNFAQKEALHSLRIIKALHASGISAFLYPDSVKMKKQFAHADNLEVEYVAIIGETEMNDNTVTLKNLASGTQETLSTDALIEKLKH